MATDLTLEGPRDRFKNLVRLVSTAGDQWERAAITVGSCCARVVLW